MPEDWKKDISKEYIKEKILNKDLAEIQESLQSLKDSIGMGDDSSNNGYFGVDNIMNIIFNNEGKIRGKIGFEACKLKSIVYMMISNEGKSNLDLLYNELEKANSESELRESLGIELSNLESEITGNEQGNESTDSESSNEGSQTDNGGNETGNEGSDSTQGSTDTVNESKIEFLNDNENYIYNQAKLYGISDKRQIAYILATVKGECGFKNIKEIGGENKKYGKEGFYGRGYVQLTHKGNYKKFTDIIKKSGLNFKDNNGNVIVGKDVDLVKNPDLVLQSNDLAAFILVYGMKNGSFTGKKLDNYINNKKCDFKNARRIINGTDHADRFAGYAEDYLDKIIKSEDDENIDNNLLIGPELLAKNRDEIGGLGNSIMYGIQGLKSKSQFKNMNGAEGKSTKNHPAVKDLEDDEIKQKIKQYKLNHPEIKSFMFYFGGNTSDNDKTLADIKKWSGWLKKEGIQPVLCTCIGVDTHIDKKTGKKWLKSLNKRIINLGEQKNYPVINFASIDEKVEKGGDNIHPTGSGYQLLRDQIDRCLS